MVFLREEESHERKDPMRSSCSFLADFARSFSIVLRRFFASMAHASLFKTLSKTFTTKRVKKTK